MVLVLGMISADFQGDVAVLTFKQSCKIKRMESPFQLVRRLVSEYQALLPPIVGVIKMKRIFLMASFFSFIAGLFSPSANE